MANKLIHEMGLPKSIVNIFAARNIRTAKDALSLTEFELMELLDVNLSQVISAVARISEVASPPYQSALSVMQDRLQNEHMSGHIPTHLRGLDTALCGGLPFGVLTELVGPAGIGKTQFCLKLALIASLPRRHGGLDGRVIYFDLESKFSSKRMIEIGVNSFPEIFHSERLAKEMAGRIVVLRPSSLHEFSERLQAVKVILLQEEVKLLIIDSMAAFASEEHEQGSSGKHSLSWHASFIKSLAEFSRIAVVVTNQVRFRSRNELNEYSFQLQDRGGTSNGLTFDGSHVAAALGIPWAHAVTIRLVLEDKSGQRFIKVAKSPISPPLTFPYIITSSGILLIDDQGLEVSGSEIDSIHCPVMTLKL